MEVQAESSQAAVEPHGVDAPVAERVLRALKEAKDYGHFRDLREFHFIHLFSGPKDVMGEALVRACAKENIKVRIESVDLKMDGTGNLLDDEPYGTILNKARADEFDAGHAGFPCGSFSRARYNKRGFGPDPVRSLKHIYGLPGNLPGQQREADRGTVMAVRSFNIVGAILESQRRRKVPRAGTLENPPGSESQEEGPAWCLPEWMQFETEFETGTALYNTCAFQEQDESKWFKPGRISGCLVNLQNLAKKCACPPWVNHVQLVGKDMTSMAAEYPKKLGETYADLLVQSFKLTLQLEWWRNQLRVKKEVVSDAQRSWIASKEKNPMVMSGPSKKVWEVKDPMVDHRPGDQRPSKRRRREEQNDRCLGGMRNPGKALSKMSTMLETGREIRDVWIDFVKDFPEAMDTARDYGTVHCQLDARVLKEWTFCLEGILKMKEFEQVTLREPWEFVSPLNPNLWQAWFDASGDPEKDLVGWIREGAPLGMSMPVPYCGVYPQVEEDEEEFVEPPNLEFQMGVENYKSFVEEPEHAAAEVQRYLEKGFAFEAKNEWVVERFKQGTVSRLALLIKEKDNGEIKRRVIIDLKRSGGNARCRLQERLVLPRVCDVVESLRYMRAFRADMMEVAHRENWKELDKLDEIEIVSADLSDAYCHLPVAKPELGNCLAPSNKEGHTLVFCAMLFGFKGAPLVMARLSGALARFWQSLLPPSEMQLQLYMDDPIFMLQGPPSKRRENLALLLYSAGAMGVQLAFKKGSRGLVLTWIGVKLEVDLAEEVLVVGINKKMIDEVKVTLTSWEGKGMLSLKEVRSTTGKLSWIAGILTRSRWCVSICYAVMTSTMADEREEVRRAQSRPDSRPKLGMVVAKRLELPRRWFLKMFEEPEKLAIRKEPLGIVPASFAIITDASPRGVGAIVAAIDIYRGNLTIIEAMEMEVTQEDAEWLGIEWDEASGQGPLEGWAVLLAVRLWGQHFNDETVLIRSDSVVALSMVAKTAGRSPVLNWLGAELALKCETLGIHKLATQHIPGAWNIEADYLSRPHQRGELPERLKGVKIRNMKHEKMRTSALPPPGVAPGMWGSTTEVVSKAFEEL